MSLRVLCPNGHELVAEPDQVGRKIRCPACKVVMVIPGPPQPVTVPPQPPPVAAEPLATTLRVLCPNGHELFAEPDQVGRKIRCPACKVVMVIPDPNPQVTAKPPPLPPPAVEEAPETLRVLCPNGHELFAKPDQIGRKIRCPACKVVMVVPDPNPQLTARPPTLPRPRVSEETFDDQEQELFEEEEPRKKKMKKRHHMRRANLGLTFHSANMLCWIIAIGLQMVALFVLPFLIGGATAMAIGGDVKGATSVAQSAVVIANIVRWFTDLALLTAPILGAIGALFCLWVPAKSGSKIFAILTLAFDAAAAVCFLLYIVMTLAGRDPAAGFALQGTGLLFFLLGALLTFVGWIMFMIFLRLLAYYVKQPGCGDEAISLMIVTIVVALGGPIVLIGLLLVLRHAGCIGAIFFFLAVLAWLVIYLSMLIRILNLIATLRITIDRRY